MSRHFLKSLSLWMIGFQLFAGCFALCVCAAEPSFKLESIATLKGAHAMQHVGAVTVSSRQNQLYIPIVEIPNVGNGGGLSIVGVSLAADKQIQVLFHQDYDKNKPATPPVLPPVVYEDPAGNLNLLAPLQGIRNAMVKINPQGEIVSRLELLAEAPNAVIRSSTLGASGDLLVVGSSPTFGVAVLVNSDLKVVWRRDFGKDLGNIRQFVAAQYDPTLKRFALVGIRGTYSKFGIPENENSEVVLKTLDYKGNTVAEKAFVGQRPSMAANSTEIALYYETPTEPRSASLCRLTWDLALVKQVANKDFIGDLPLANLPIMILDDHHRIIALNRASAQSSSLFVYDSDLKLVAKHADPRPLGIGQPFPLKVGDALYLITSGFAAIPAPKTPLADIANDVFIERIELK